MNKKIITLLLLPVLLYVLSGCAGQTVETGREEMREEPAVQMSHAEQKEQAYEIFKQILELSDSPDRQANLPQIKQLYREIIDKYPDVGLAQECYLRLVLFAKAEKTAAGNAEAEKLYQEFSQKYPDSKLQKVIENELRSNG
jgi:hypothetical protein